LRTDPRRARAAPQPRLSGPAQANGRADDEAAHREARAVRSPSRDRRGARGHQEALGLADDVRGHDRPPHTRCGCDRLGDQLTFAGAPGTEPGRRQAPQTASVKGPRAYELEESQPAQVRRERTYFDRWDLLAVLGLTAVAFVLRFYSPIMPDFFVHPFQSPAVTNCVPNTPINPEGDPGTLCGLAYPFNRGYPDQNKVLSPPDGQVFDEIYFPVDAHIDFLNTQCHPHSIYCPYFDPEPPLAKLIIGAGEWGYGWYRATFQGATGAYIDLGFNTFG